MDYLPLAENAFNEWQANFTKQVTENLAAWNIPPAAADALVKAKAIYDPAYLAANKGVQKVRTPKQTKVKNDATAAYMAAIRRFVKQWLAFNDAVTDAERLALGITVRDVVRTASGIPQSIPNIVVVPMPGSCLKITFRQAPNAEGISRRGKPADVAEIEIAAWVGDAVPADGDGCNIKSRYTKSPVLLQFKGEDAGKTANVFGRWIGKGKQPGPWSNAFAEVISK